MKKKYISSIVLICSFLLILSGSTNSNDQSYKDSKNVLDQVDKKEEAKVVDKKETSEEKIKVTDTKENSQIIKKVTYEEAMGIISKLDDLSFANTAKLSFMDFGTKPQGQEGYSFQVGTNGETSFETIGYYFVSTEGATYKLNIITNEFEPIK